MCKMYLASEWSCSESSEWHCRQYLVLEATGQVAVSRATMALGTAVHLEEKAESHLEKQGKEHAALLVNHRRLVLLLRRLASPTAQKRHACSRTPSMNDCTLNVEESFLAS